MSIRTSIIIAIGLFVAIPITSLYGGRFSKQKTTFPTVTASGLEEAGIRLIPAYPRQSWQAMILSNESNHYLIAIAMIYEITREDGQKITIPNIILSPEIAAGKDSVTINTDLDKNTVISPQSKWLVGLGFECVQLTDVLPTFGKAQSQTYVQDLEFTSQALKNINVVLDGIIIEDGRMLGPQKSNPRQLIADAMRSREMSQNENDTK